MTDEDRDLGTERYAYSRKALGRLVLSYEMRELADRAAVGVPTGDDHLALPGEEVRAALDLVDQSQEVLTRAVLFERTKGTSWETIAEKLGIRRQSAEARYREAEQAWEDALHDPYDREEPRSRHRSLRLHEAAYAPIGAGQDLDEWAQQQGQGTHAVTGGLPTLPLQEELGQVLDGLSYLDRDRHKPPDPAVRLQLTERKAVLLDRIAHEEDRPEAALQAEEARALAAQIRSEIEGTP
ncbi:hypothetical protein ACFWGI_06680 [Streptomyces niveus]|uniref:hypothetical protein n=1 Tax=Streptomyces niveus TaxID=193462 RepID=UPI00364DB423